MAAFGYRRPGDLPDTIPVFPLDSAILLPRAILPLNVFEPRYLNMIDDVIAGDRLIGMVQTTTGGPDQAPALTDVGGVGRLTSFAETSDGRYLISLTGVCRFSIVKELDVTTPYRKAKVDFEPFASDLDERSSTAGFDRGALLAELTAFLRAHDLSADWSSVEAAPAETLVNSLAMVCPFAPPEKQALLEAETLQDRVDTLRALLRSGQAGPADPTKIS